ncbi:DUF1799 domain-containing protein [Comamonas sp. J-3]|uniref:DUF1799 domain-containing protein n=1 Tax=Comamonas trifloxystrobinivorans TaxID=3350256 RepID=UPI00372BCB73
MRRLAGQGAWQVRRSFVHRPTGKLRAIARALYEPHITEAEAKAAGFELEDYETETLEVWPDNEVALELAHMIGTRWVYPPMGGPPLGLRWEAMYPLMDRKAPDKGDWDELHAAMMIVESVALDTIREFAPKDKTKQPA